MSVRQAYFNFSAGPAVLPESVLLEAQRDLVALPGVGMSVLEISHRSKTFETILATTEADLRTLGGVPANYKVLFLQGGASLQFSMVPMNLLTPGTTADYIVTGGWAQKAVKEAQRVGTVHIAASTESENFARIPRQDELTLTPGAAYVHFTTNNTLFGTEWQAEPAVGDVPLVADTSSDIFSRPIDVAKYGLDLRRRAEEPRPVRRHAGDRPRGPAGAVGEVAAHDAELRRARRERLDVQHAAVLRHLPDGPGDEVGAGRRAGSRPSAPRNARKAAALYAEIDRTGFYRGTAAKDSRSQMNVTFRLPSEELEKRVRQGSRPRPGSTG